MNFSPKQAVRSWSFSQRPFTILLNQVFLKRMHSIGNNSLHVWISNWKNRQLDPKQWRAAATALTLAAAFYCAVCGVIFGSGLHLTLSMAWALGFCSFVAVGVAALNALLRRYRDPQVLYGLAFLVLFANCVALVAYGKTLLYVFYGDPWVAFWPTVIKNLPQALIPVGIVGLPYALSRQQQIKAIETPKPSNSVFTVQSNKGITLDLVAQDIVYIKGAGNYVEIESSKGNFIMRSTLSKAEQKVSELGFIRVHRSYVINTQHIVTKEKTAFGQTVLVLKPDQKIPIGRNFKHIENTL